MKKYWIFLNIIILIIFIASIIYGFFILKPQASQSAIEGSRKHVIVIKDLDKIPDSTKDAGGYKPIYPPKILDIQESHSEEEHPQENKVEEEQQIILSGSHDAKISIIITGLGNNTEALKRVESFPSAINLGYTPYSPNITSHLNEVTSKGHEIYVLVPFEPQNYPLDDPGPLVILKSEHNKANPNRLNSILTKYTNISGVYSDIGEKFTSSAEELAPILETIAAKEISFIYGNGNKNEIFNGLTTSYDNKVAFMDILLDHEINERKIREQLVALEALARDRSIAIAYIRPYPISLSILEEWIKTLNNKGIILVPASQITKEG